jgi:shikimate dehydrogenase
MNLYGLIGFPLSHSFSQRYFTEKFAREGISDCGTNFFNPSIESFRDIWVNNPDLKRMNVTIPYKEKVIPFLDIYNDVVLKTGACNCIKIEWKIVRLQYGCLRF